MINQRMSKLTKGVLLAMSGMMALATPLLTHADTTIQQIAGKVLPYQAKPRVFVLSDIGNVAHPFFTLFQ